MCIRDSNKIDGRFTEVDLDLFASLASSISEAVENAWLFTRCLLYTSDAADERSSVDLGGRRIIKKKTTTAIDAVRV